MRKVQGKIVYSPSDLIVFMESPFASWMDRFRLEFPDKAQPDDDDASLKLLQQKGNEHEAAYLARLKADGKDICEIAIGSDALAETLAAMQAGREIIYQGAVRLADFSGRSDFLIKADGASNLGDYHYQVWDTKLSRKAKPYFLIQLSCYAEMLQGMQNRLPEFIGIVLGDLQEKRFRTQDFYYYYQALKQAFLEKEASFDPDKQPLPAPMEDCRHWSSVAEQILEERDHLSRVANVRRTQIKKLESVGITTMRQLAETKLTHVPKMELVTLQTLSAQARLQIESVNLDKPKFEVLPHEPSVRRGLAMLSPASELDVFFDMEGYPHVEGGLEYLFGASYFDGGELAFEDWWAHDRDAEKKAFEDFVDWIYDRWQRDPNMHVYHYADYEVSAMRRLMGRHATREREVDALLRNEVFVNLFTVVRQGLRVGASSYSIKKVELLYRPKRATEVATAMDSVVFYQNWLEEPDGLDWRSSNKLKDIRDYNKDDCDSTAQLFAWLRSIQDAEHIKTVPLPPKQEASTAAEARNEAALLAQELLNNLPADEPARSLQELLAQLLEFHWREAKPVFWAKFDRREMTADQLIDDANCLGGLRRTDSPPEKVKRSIGYEFSFDPAQDTKLDVGKKCFFAHDTNLKTDIYSFDDERGLIGLKISQQQGPPPDTLNLIPDEFVSGALIAESIYNTVATWRSSGKLPGAIEDFLLRRRPNLTGNSAGPIVLPTRETTEAVIDAIKSMNDTTLCIQGPPGSGKTTNGAQIIVALLKAGKRVGVSSNSHKAIANLLEEVEKDAIKSGLRYRGTKIQSKPEDFHLDGTSIVPNEKADVFTAGADYQLIGGTAWTFSDPSAIDALDYLFVDEAGQVSIANLVGMAPSTKNIVLMGDQMQLGQPIQGSHPGNSGQSVLEYLLQDHQTIPKDFGIFFATTYRMHPDVCQFISSAVYDGRLHSADATLERKILVPASSKLLTKSSGLLYVPVEHEGNTQESDEEADTIEALIRELLACEFSDREVKRQLQPEDILVVAPYNMQVRMLKPRHLHDKVGTVDKFQGQQAPVVIVSMCASDGNESARGIEFLFSRNRLNVAISRAKCLAIVVGAPSLARTPATNVDQMGLVNLFCRIVQDGQHAGAQPKVQSKV